MKVKKHFYCIVVVLALLTAGCGGGGGGSFVPTPPPSNPPSSSPPSNPPDNPPPSSNPSDNSLQPPPPSNPQPPNPAPTLRVWYPGAGDPESIRVVGSGTLLTILGEVYNAELLGLYDTDGSLLETFPVNGGFFRIDISRFGSAGRKTLRLVARGPGGESTVGLEVINDEVELEGLAREAIERYRMKRFGKSPWCNEIPVPVWVENPEHRTQVEEALRFWSRYTHLRFVITEERPSPPSVSGIPAIYIFDETTRDPGYIAGTRVGSSTGEALDAALIFLYSRFAGLQPAGQSSVIAHEMWHVLLDTIEHPGTELGIRFIGYPYHPFNLATSTIPPVIQRVIDILYR